MRDFASELSSEGDREVIFSDQPKLDKRSKLPIIDQHAEALLAVLQEENKTQRPVDIIAHSLGSLVAVRMAELAKQRGLNIFESESGSHTVFISPAGSNDNENLGFLAGRFAKFMVNGLKYGKELDPTGEMMKAGTKNFLETPVNKTAREVHALRKKQYVYKKLGDLGIKPFVFGYAADDMFPHGVIQSVMSKYEDSLAGYAVPIDNGIIGAENFESFKQKTGLSGKEARRAWAHHYRNAGHNDLLFHPERTVKSVLEIIDM